LLTIVAVTVLKKFVFALGLDLDFAAPKTNREGKIVPLAALLQSGETTIFVLG